VDTGFFFDALGVTNVHVNQTGFSQSYRPGRFYRQRISYIANLTNPFPGGFLLPTRASAWTDRPASARGSVFFDENTTSSYMQRWQLAVQRELTSRTLIEVSMSAIRGTRMQVSRDLDPVPRNT
jgi:hypothetical protein